MQRFIPSIILASLFVPSLLFAQTSNYSTYEARRAAVVGSVKNYVVRESGKHGLPRAIAQLQLDPHNAAAIEYIVNSPDPRRQTMFDFPGLALALCRYWDSFSSEQRKSLQTALERLAKSDKKDGEGFLGHGTENHALLMWAPVILFCELFPDAKWCNGMNSDQLKADMKERLRKTFKNYYARSYTEYLSTTYETVLIIPIEILFQYTKDPEVRDMAEAFLLYHWSLLALNSFDGEIVAPFGRMNTQQDHLHADKLHSWDNVAALSYYNWVLFGWGAATDNMRIADFVDFNEASYGIYGAMSGVNPGDWFFELAANKTPMTVRTSASTFGHYGTGVPNMMLRKIYRTGQYAIGTGNFRWVPGGDYADHDTNGFCIMWNSKDQFNYLNCTHPYWYSEGDDISRTAESWNHGSVSPFQQTAQHENTAIVLFDIPEKDPWPNKPSAQKWAWRNRCENNLVKRGMIRFPKSIDGIAEENGWIFLREGKTYIAIKPLKDCYWQRESTDVSLIGFNVIKSDHAKTGFIFEVGTEEEFKNFGEFRKKIPTNKIDVDWDTTTVAYTNSCGSEIRIKFVPGLPVVPVAEIPDHWKTHLKVDGIAESIPEITIDGKPERSPDDWPLIGSPTIGMKGSVLKIKHDDTIISVDWTGELPKIARLIVL